MSIAAVLEAFLFAFVTTFFFALQLVIFARVILSWIPMRLPLDLNDMIWGISETILGPIRRALPPMSGFDLSPLLALVALEFVQRIVRSALAYLPYPG